MATFQNILNTDVTVQDENGLAIRFGPLEVRSGLSDFLFRYTAQGGSDSPLLSSASPVPQKLPPPQSNRNANKIVFDNSDTEILGDTVQEALEELDARGGGGGGYNPGDETQWESPEPTTVSQALDRLVSFLNNHLGSTKKP